MIIQITHVFREANQLRDCIVNEVIDTINNATIESF